MAHCSAARKGDRPTSGSTSISSATRSSRTCRPTRPDRGNTNAVDGHDVPVRHFGVVLTMANGRSSPTRLRAAHTRFVIEPYVRFKGQVGEQATMFFLDPCGNALEFKAFADDCAAVRQVDSGWRHADHRKRTGSDDRYRLRRGVPLVLHRQAQTRGRRSPCRKPPACRRPRCAGIHFSSTRTCAGRHFAQAIPGRQVRWPAARGRDLRARAAAGRDAGLDLNIDGISAPAEYAGRARPDCVRAAGHGAGSEVKERLLKAYFIENRFIGDPDVWRKSPPRPAWMRRARACRQRPGAAASGGRGRRAGRGMGISGVPFFIFKSEACRLRRAGSRDPAGRRSPGVAAD